ncbi:type II toxin-antitoxin system Phd/YefM family antitoxin [Streptomyces fractus]|uniref:type II toxin-antitoxin system Phd/YefM family antitoxin n=1 Tax=Streptomyces fractus TaxID=641806 RepID=UPI003CEB2A22
MIVVELDAAVEDFGRLVAHVEETGEHVSIIDDGRPVSVLLPAAEVVALEHWAQRQYGALTPHPAAVEELPCGPTQHGAYMQYLHADGGRMTFTRDQVVVAELRPARWFKWLVGETLHDRRSHPGHPDLT